MRTMTGLCGNRGSRPGGGHFAPPPQAVPDKQGRRRNVGKKWDKIEGGHFAFWFWVGSFPFSLKGQLYIVNSLLALIL